MCFLKIVLDAPASKQFFANLAHHYKILDPPVLPCFYVRQSRGRTPFSRDTEYKTILILTCRQWILATHPPIYKQLYLYKSQPNTVTYYQQLFEYRKLQGWSHVLSLSIHVAILTYVYVSHT